MKLHESRSLKLLSDKTFGFSSMQLHNKLVLETICHQHHASIEDLHGKRCYLYRRQEGIYPAFEEFYVVAPNLAKNKCRNLKAFDQHWSMAVKLARAKPLMPQGVEHVVILAGMKIVGFHVPNL